VVELAGRFSSRYDNLVIECFKLRDLVFVSFVDADLFLVWNSVVTFISCICIADCKLEPCIMRDFP